MTGRPTGQTRLAGVMGDPVRHSLSPLLQNTAFAACGLDWLFVAFPVPGGQAGVALAGMRALGIEGLSVTMPHKTEVAGLVDELSDTAARLGAVNTVSRRGDRLIGHSTDGDGFVDALRIDHGVDVAGLRCLVVGAGGAARAVVLALVRAGSGPVVVVNRTPAAGERAAALAGERGRVGTAADVAEVDLVVNATPLGMAGGPAADLPVPAELIRPGQIVADLVYHPLATPLLTEAARRGAATVDGLGMLVHQAAHAFRLWTGMDAPVADMASAARAELARG